jgi:serine/threonine protein kinase
MSFDNLIGSTFGSYQLLEMIGRGGMATVYRARQVNLRREVAIKVLLPSLSSSDPQFNERFHREAQTSAALEHAHIIPIYDYGIENHYIYLAMRLLTGGTLSDRLHAQNKLPSLSEVIEITRQLASALDYAHSRGVIHRDIKGSNVLFDQQGSAYLSDFGIAKLLDSGTAITGTGTVMGTPSYMSPEQWMSEAITPASDQYSFGMLVYEMLTGQLPFSANTPYELMYKHLHEIAASVTSVRSDLPSALTPIFNKALSKDPKERYPSILAFAQALETVKGDSRISTGFFTAPPPAKSATSPSKDLYQTPPTLPPLKSNDITGRVYEDFPTIYPSIPSERPTAGRNIPWRDLLGLIAAAILVLLLIGYGMSYLAQNTTIFPQIGTFIRQNLLFIALLPVVLLAGDLVWRRAIQPRLRAAREAQKKPANTPGLRVPPPPVVKAEPAPVVPSVLINTLPKDDDTMAPPLKPPNETPLPLKSGPSPRVMKTLYTMTSGLTLGDRYELRQRLDKGDKHHVYLAFDNRREHDVAVKVLASGATDEQRKRFKQEAKILSSLLHPHIVPFYDYASEDMVSYISMPLLLGGTLKERCHNEPIPMENLWNYVNQLSGAMGYMHNKGIVHRDLKASNILFNEQENLFIVDFGIAKMVDEAGNLAQENLTNANQVVGSPAYMAPERWVSGMPLTPASDQYSLGIVVYQMLTGRLPFENANPYAVMHSHVYDEPNPPSTLNPKLPAMVDEVVLRALAKNPNKRFPSIGEFTDSLGKAFTGTPSLEIGKPAGHIFVSYSRRDSEYVEKLVADIESRDLPVWMDRNDIDFGTIWLNEVEDAISESFAVIVVMTPEARNSEWVQREVLLALNLKKPIFPLLLQDTMFLSLVNLQPLDVRGRELPPSEFYQRLGRLMTTRKA